MGRRAPCPDCESGRGAREAGPGLSSLESYLKESQAQQARLTELLTAAQEEVGRLNKEKIALAVELAHAQTTIEVLHQGVDALNDGL